MFFNFLPLKGHGLYQCHPPLRRQKSQAADKKVTHTKVGGSPSPLKSSCETSLQSAMINLKIVVNNIACLLY